MGKKYRRNKKKSKRPGGHVRLPNGSTMPDPAAVAPLSTDPGEGNAEEPGVSLGEEELSEDSRPLGEEGGEEAVFEVGQEGGEEAVFEGGQEEFVVTTTEGAPPLESADIGARAQASNAAVEAKLDAIISILDRGIRIIG